MVRFYTTIKEFEREMLTREKTVSMERELNYQKIVTIDFILDQQEQQQK